MAGYERSLLHLQLHQRRCGRTRTGATSGNYQTHGDCAPPVVHPGTQSDTAKASCRSTNAGASGSSSPASGPQCKQPASTAASICPTPELTTSSLQLPTSSAGDRLATELVGVVSSIAIAQASSNRQRKPTFQSSRGIAAYPGHVERNASASWYWMEHCYRACCVLI